jgi:hypothetical protein
LATASDRACLGAFPYPIETGQPYAVRFDATWMNDGRRREQTREVTMRPGEQAIVRFSNNTPEEPPLHIDKVPE